MNEGLYVTKSLKRDYVLRWLISALSVFGLRLPVLVTETDPLYLFPNGSSCAMHSRAATVHES